MEGYEDYGPLSSGNDSCDSTCGPDLQEQARPEPSDEDFERAKDRVHAEIMDVIGDREAFKTGWLVGLVATLELRDKELKAAEARNEALLQALKEFLWLVDEKEWAGCDARIYQQAEALVKGK